MKNLGIQIWLFNEANVRLLSTSLISETEKAFSIRIDRGEFVVREQILWIPKSICKVEVNNNYKMFKDQKEDEISPLFKLTIPNWFARKNNL